MYAIRVSGVWEGVVARGGPCREWMGAAGLEPEDRFHFFACVGHLYVNLAIAGKVSIFLS